VAGPVADDVDCVEYWDGLSAVMKSGVVDEDYWTASRPGGLFGQNEETYWDDIEFIRTVRRRL
jgi:hypothetical protein